MAQAIIAKLVQQQCEYRYTIGASSKDGYFPRGDEKDSLRARAFLERMDLWANDAVAFFNECIWVPDPKGLFGGRSIQRGLSPPQMVPFVVFDPQSEQVETIRECAAWIRDKRDGRLDVNKLKSRQIAYTTIPLGCFFHAWLFLDNFHAIVGSYSDDVVDSGGKDHRSNDSLFGRLRMMIDGFMWQMTPPGQPFSLTRFTNSRILAKRGRPSVREQEDPTGMNGSQDSKGRLTRPPWIIFGTERYPNARGNTISGATYGDTFGKAKIFSVGLFDEYGDTERGKDRPSYASLAPCCPKIWTQGTIPAGGSQDTHFYELCERIDSRENFHKSVNLWTSVPVYMIGAWWTCQMCGNKNKWGDPVHQPPADGENRKCQSCGNQRTVVRRDLLSPWFVDQTANMSPSEIARYYWCEWGAAATGLVFPDFDPGTQVKRVLASGGDWVTIQGYDPGHSERNPAAWVCLRYSRSRQALHVAGFHQAAGWPIQKWVPYFKLWQPKALRHMRVLHDERMRSFAEYEYTESDLFVLGHAARYAPGDIFGDKYGTHNDGGAGSAYDALSRYGITVNAPYAKRDNSPENALVKLRDVWLPRMTVDPEVNEHKPRYSGGVYPSLTQAFQTARWIETEGQTAPKREISEKAPRYVKHGIDAVRYAIRDLDRTVDAVVGLGGEMMVRGDEYDEVLVWGETL